MLNIQLTSLPIWVKFYNIPLEYWTNTCLGYIPSAIGKPLHLDSLTENRSRLSFARICIEVDWNSEFPKFALLNLGNGKFTTVRIEYPWVPHICSHCQVFGHKTFHCPISKETNAKMSLDSTNLSGYSGARHANGKGTIADSRAGIHKDLNQAKDPDGGFEGIIDSISERLSIALPVISDKTEFKVDGGETSPILTGNTFECLALSEAIAPIEGVGVLGLY